MDITNLMSQARQMKGKMAKIQEELAKKTVTGSAGGGMVTTIVSGRGDLLKINIEKELLSSDDVEMLQDLIVAATNDGLRKANELGKSEMGQLAGGMNIPGLSSLF